jgi:hypothetical protein
MSGDNADRIGRAYRAAGEALDERPSAATRAAILAAAARQIHAAPRDASAPMATPVRRMPRWPMAAAAAVLLSTLAVMMAVRTEHEMPTFTPPAESEAARVPAAAPSAATAPTTDTVAQGAAAPIARAPSLDKDRTGAAVTPASPRTGAGADAKRRDAEQLAESKVTEPGAGPRAKEEATALAAPASAPPAAPPVAGQRAAPAPAPSAAAADAASAEAAAPAPAVERRRNEVAGTARAPARQAPEAGATLGAATEQPRAEKDAPANELRAEEWLERIVKLRQAGRHDDADAELKRFRERHPQVHIPAAALPPSGTR